MARRMVLIGAALVIAAALGGLGGYLVRDRQPTATILTGRFYAGDRQAEATVGGWSYGLVDGVTWQDMHGTWHDRGWPDCLTPAGSVHTVRFAYTPVTGLPAEWRQVVWVSCVGS